ncbi:DUF4835 family protein [Olivibacter sp. CPCC 100613]|uniref:type IX secretion system protein PorD n=1 Tax=Olivibacter sp. CPCC 100613 TaxID=3079931 RepID=UPI002FFBF6A9
MTRTFVSFLLFSLLSFAPIWAQDLNARVQILSPQVQATNKRAFDVLQQAMTDFLNNKKWSNQQILPEERIDCSLVITVKEWDGSSNYKAEAQIISTRPVYNTTYNSPVLTLSDKNFDFTYTEGEPLDFSSQQYLSNITSLLAYYAYLIVGLDADSFSEKGGTSYYTLAQNVVNNAQTANFTGWKSIESMNNRFWLVNNMLDNNYEPLRSFSYRYHLEVLDKMADNQNASKRTLIDLLPLLAKVDRMVQGAMYNQAFFTAKSDELANLIGGLTGPEKAKAINILAEADPGNSNKYETIKSL